MLDKIADIKRKHRELSTKLSSDDIASNLDLMIKLGKEMATLDPIYTLACAYEQCVHEIAEAEEILRHETDPELIQMAKEQLTDAKQRLARCEQELTIALLPKDENDERNIFLEIRPAAWGDEAGLFASELLKAYTIYAKNQGRTVEVIDEQLNDLWWVKFVMLKISGQGVYAKLKWESGVHRVQRIPATESQGRIHTSTITVAIMPEVDDVSIDINPDDIIIDTYAASSAWWQNANKNQTWVRIHHKPSWLIVNIGDSKSQLKNKEKALSVLKSRLYQIEHDKRIAESRDIRGGQIGSGDRSEKIRTYNYPQDRITDHRIKMSRSNIPFVMLGNLDDIINTCIREAQLKALSSTDIQ